MSPREALDRITALCDERQNAKWTPLPDGIPITAVLSVHEVRAVLAEVSPEPGGDMQSPLTRPGDMQSFGPESYKSGGVLVRDQARAVLDDFDVWPGRDEVAFLDALARCVRPAAIDRDALTGVLRKWADHRGWEISDSGIEDMVEDILALVRPVAGVAVVDRSSGREVGGVVLTPEEADDLEAVLQLGLDVYMDSARGPRLRALAARLEAAS